MTTSDNQEKGAQAAELAEAAEQAQTEDPQEIIGEGELGSEEILERTILFALDEAAEQLEQSGEVEPFTVLVKGEELFVEEQPSGSEDECYAAARRSVFQMEKLCNAYVFCYDGFVDLESGTSDALIAEFANKGDEMAQVIVRLYSGQGDELEIEEALYHVGETDSLFGSKPEDMQRGEEVADGAQSDTAADTDD